MSSPAATEGAYQDGNGSTPSDQDIHQSDRRQGHGNGGYYHQDDSHSPPTPTAQGVNRRGGLSEISNHLYSQRHAVQQHMQSPDEIMNAAAIASRDKNLDNFTTNTATASAAAQGFDFHNANDSQHSPPPTAHVPLQIRYTPHSRQGSIASHSRQGSVTGLQIRTDIPSAKPKSTAVASRDHIQQLHPSISSHTLDSASSASATLTPTGNLRKAISTASLSSSLSPNGGLPSPALAAMIDITPLPSPIMPGEQLSPVPWKRVRSKSRNRSNEHERPSTLAGAEIRGSSSKPPPRFHMPMSPASPPKKKKGYGNLLPPAVEGQASPSTLPVNAQVNASAHDQNQMAHQKQRVVSHGRNRSISDFVPEQLHNVRPRHVTINLSSAPLIHPPVNHDPTMHREQYLATQRGHPPTTASPLSVPATLLDPSNALPSPPPSNKSVSSELDEEDYHPVPQDQEDANVEYFQVRDAHNPSKKRKWRAIRELGQGTFSKVMLASSERLPPGTPYTSDHLNPSKLVAIKVVEHGPAGGADEERIEVSLKREVDILKSVSHPCIVQLKAMEYSEDRALLVLTFCPGGDLFELASQKREVLTRNMVQRIFAEVVAAVRYLHEMGVVHRDLKLESMFCPLSSSLCSFVGFALRVVRFSLLLDLFLSSARRPLPLVEKYSVLQVCAPFCLPLTHPLGLTFHRKSKKENITVILQCLRHSIYEPHKKLTSLSP